MKTLRTTLGDVIMDERFNRLLKYGCTESQALSLTPHVSITSSSSDNQVEAQVIEALVNAKQATSPVPALELLGGSRRDTLRKVKGGK